MSAVKYDTCPACGQEQAPYSGCTISHITMAGKEHERIRVGDALDFDPEMDEGHICHYCLAGKGQFHHARCGAESCSVCGGQCAYCACE